MFDELLSQGTRGDLSRFGMHHGYICSQITMRGITCVFDVHRFAIDGIDDVVSDELIERSFEMRSYSILHGVPPVKGGSAALPKVPGIDIQLKHHFSSLFISPRSGFFQNPLQQRAFSKNEQLAVILAIAPLHRGRCRAKE